MIKIKFSLVEEAVHKDTKVPQTASDINTLYLHFYYKLLIFIITIILLCL